MEEELLRRSRVIKAFAAENAEDKFLEDASRSRVRTLTFSFWEHFLLFLLLMTCMLPHPTNTCVL